MNIELIVKITTTMFFIMASLSDVYEWPQPESKNKLLNNILMRITLIYVLWTYI